MKDIDELIKFMKSKEGKVSISKCIHEMSEKQKNRDEIIKKMLSNTDYINWLISFTKDKDGFFDSDYDYSSEKLNEIDQKNVNLLPLLFEGIYDYAKKNYIYSSEDSLGEYYQVKKDDNGFQIGYISGQGTDFYCKKIPVEKNEYFIDFMDIVNNKKQDNVDYIRNSMDNLSYWLIGLVKSGVPIQALIEAFNKTMKAISDKNKEDEKQKTLKKQF